MKNIKRDGGRSSDKLRSNKEIRAEEVRVVTDSGEMLGVLSLRDALATAKDRGLDLVEISPNTNPPVCKIIDYGKFRYEKHKKQKEAKKKQNIVNIKETKLRINIGEHDYQVKLKNSRKFIESNDKVKVTLRFRGREIVHNKVAMELFQRFKGDLEDIAKAELEPKMEGRQMVMVLSPDNK